MAHPYFVALTSHGKCRGAARRMHTRRRLDASIQLVTTTTTTTASVAAMVASTVQMSAAIGIRAGMFRRECGYVS
jgi:hypothetical protein